MVVFPVSAQTATVSGNPDLSIVPEQNTFAPGETGRFTFSIMNDGDIENPGPQGLNSQVKVASGLTYSIGDRGNASINVREDITAVGDVPDGLFPRKQGFRINVWENASSGRYYVPIDLSYRYIEDIEYDTNNGAIESYVYDDTFKTAKVVLKVRETANLNLVDSSFSGSTGESGVLSLTVENTGNTSVKDTTLNLQSKDQDLSFGKTASSERYIGEWEAGETKNLDFRASVAPNTLTSEMTVEATSTFQNDGFRETNSFSFGVEADSDTKIQIDNIEADLRKGSENMITGEIDNQAGRELTDLQLNFRPDDPRLTVKQNSYAVGTLDEGDKAEFSFPVEVSSNAEPGPRIYDLNAVYDAADGSSEARTDLSFNAEIIGSEGDFIVNSADNSVKQGEKSVYSINVTNPSSSTYENVDAKIFASDPISTSDDRAFVSELTPGESEVLKFELSAGSSAIVKQYPVRMDFRYEVGDDSKYSDTYRTPVLVEEKESSGPPVVPIAAVTLLILLSASFYLRRPEVIWSNLIEE